MEAPFTRMHFDDTDLDDLGFHDCHITNLSWDDAAFSFIVKLDYIVKWLTPGPNEQAFRFWISAAVLVFENVDDVEVGLQWQNARMVCCINNLLRQEFRLTPNGTKQWHWLFDLHEPSGQISLWATGFQLKLLDTPVLSESQRL